MKRALKLGNDLPDGALRTINNKPKDYLLTRGFCIQTIAAWDTRNLTMTVVSLRR